MHSDSLTTQAQLAKGFGAHDMFVRREATNGLPLSNTASISITPLIEYTNQQLDSAIERVTALIVHVRAARTAMFGSLEKGPEPVSTPNADKDTGRPLAEIARYRAARLDAELCELENNTKILLNQLL